VINFNQQTMSDSVEMVLTCGSWQEAQRIADILLEEQLVRSIESFEIKSMNWQEQYPHSTKQVKVLVLTSHAYVEKIEALVNRLKAIHTNKLLLTQLNKW
jgi:uncharacterized protein involved in tolerance to divalent cations